MDTNPCGALALYKFATTLVITIPSRAQTPKTWRLPLQLGMWLVGGVVAKGVFERGVPTLSSCFLYLGRQLYHDMWPLLPQRRIDVAILGTCLGHLSNRKLRNPICP